MTEESRTAILRQREVASLNYKYECRHDPNSEKELQRSKTRLVDGARTWRKVTQVHSALVDRKKEVCV